MTVHGVRDEAAVPDASMGLFQVPMGFRTKNCYTKTLTKQVFNVHFSCASHLNNSFQENQEIKRVPALKEQKPSHRELATAAFLERKEKRQMIKTPKFTVGWSFILKIEREITFSVAALFLQV